MRCGQARHRELASQLNQNGRQCCESLEKDARQAQHVVGEAQSLLSLHDTREGTMAVTFNTLKGMQEKYLGMTVGPRARPTAPRAAF